MNRAVAVVLLLGLAALAATAWWLREPSPEATSEPAAPADEAAAEADDAAEPGPPRFPLPTDEAATADDEPLPPLAESDESVREALSGLEGTARLVERLVPQRLVERFVATIHALDGDSVPLKLWPVSPTPGSAEVDPAGEGRYRWSRANHDRYAPYVRAFTAIDPERLAALYLRLYPLLQEAYDDLGEAASPYFNDRFIAILDHLLATPEAPERPLLVRPKVLYQYADPQLESLSAGQKLLLRMGPEQAAAVKAQLAALRAAIVARTIPADSDPEAEAEPEPAPEHGETRGVDAGADAAGAAASGGVEQSGVTQ